MKISTRFIFLAGNCFLTLILAYLFGTLAATYLRQQILLLPAPSNLQYAPDKTLPLKDNSRNKEDFSGILETNIFQAQRDAVELPPEPLPPLPESEILDESHIKKEEILAPTVLNLSLSGTMLSSNYAFAFISPKGNLRNYTIFSKGDCFFPKTVKMEPACNPNSVRILSIEDRKVILQHKGVKSVLLMEVSAAEKAKVAAFIPAPSRSAPLPPRVQPKPRRILPPKKIRTRPSPKIKSLQSSPTDENSFHFQREWVDEQLANFNKLLNDARVVPTKKSGKTLFLFKFIKPDSIYEKLGLKQDDIILEINGFVVDTLPKALKLLETLQSEREIVLKIERKEKPVVFRYYID